MKEDIAEPDPSLRSLSPALMRALARALMPQDAVVSREEAIELLPLGATEGRQWFDRNMKVGRFVGHHTLFCWGDVAAALNGVARKGHEASDASSASAYMNVHEAAAYLRFPTLQALRMAVARGQIVVSAKRGRVWLFKREDLDRQLAAGKCREAVDRANAVDAGGGREATTDSGTTAPLPEQRPVRTRARVRQRARRPVDTDDPYGLEAALREAYPPSPKTRRKD